LTSLFFPGCNRLPSHVGLTPHRYTDLCVIAFGEGHISTTSGLKQKAEIAWQEGDYGRALALINEALALQVKSLGKLDLAVVSTLQYRARVYKLMNHFDKVGPVYGKLPGV